MSKFTKLFKGSSSSSSSSSSRSKHHHKSRGGPTPQEAIHKLRETEEMLTKKQDYLEKKIEQELMTAKKHGTKNKRRKFLLDKSQSNCPPVCIGRWYYYVPKT